MDSPSSMWVFERFPPFGLSSKRHHFVFDHGVFHVCRIYFDGRIVRNGFDDLESFDYRMPMKVVRLLMSERDCLLRTFHPSINYGLRDFGF